VKLQTLLPDTVQKAIGCYLSIAYGSQARGRRGPDLTTIEGKAAEACLSVFQKEQVEPIPGHPCVRYSLRLGNRNYPFMKLVLQEHLLAGEFYFAVDTHDQMDIKPDYPDYEAWMAVRRFNRDLKRQIEDEFGRQGIDTAACLCRAVREREVPASGGTFRGSVLIVDDELDLADAVELLLRARGFRTFKIHDGKSAVRAVGELMPDMVLLDYELPELDGLQVIAQLRADPLTQGVPVLLASAAKVSMADIRKADGFLAKPFQEDLLYQMVDRVLRSREVRS
jgi:CheY-like chemotaxis protein